MKLQTWFKSQFAIFEIFVEKSGFLVCIIEHSFFQDGKYFPNQLKIVIFHEKTHEKSVFRPPFSSKITI